MNFAASPDAKLTRDQRKAVILQAGVEIANEFGLQACKPLNVASRCALDTSIHTVRKYFWSNGELWMAIAKHKDASPDVRKVAKTLGLI